MMNVDDAYAAADSLFGDVKTRLESIRSEEDAKLQIITRVLTESLGWSHSDIQSESPNKNGFSDYLITDGNHKALLVEAKKIGEIALATSSQKRAFLKISGPVLSPASDAISQAASYCLPEGIPLAAVTDGIKWIVFLPWVPQASYKDKQAVVFPGPDAILADFSLFFELLAKSEYRKGSYRLVFDRIHENRLVLDRPLEAPIPSAENSIVQKSALAFDLDKVFSSFFAGLTGEDDPDMIIDCFVETKESRVADFSLERITKNVLGNMASPDKDVAEGLRSIVSDAVAGDPGQTVFIVGPSGAGKSTFLDRFFKRTLSAEIRGQCVVIYVNSLDASGDEAVALPWMTESAIKSIEKQLFPNGYPEWDDLQGLYHLEYVKRSKGVDAPLYKRSKEEFKEKFATYVEEQVEKDRETYLRRLLADLVRNRKKLPIFVIDNTDEFTLSYKTVVFQYFQALRRAVSHCILLFPATDRSAWAFSKTEVFNIYSSRSFFLPTPSPREVFRKRVDYLKGKLKTGGTEHKAEYFAGRGIRVKIRDLGAFAEVIENVFVDQDYTSRQVGELSNYNMRKALGLSKRIITSSVIKIDDLINSYLTGTMIAPTPEKFMNALLKGDYEFFRPGDEPLLTPVYQVDSLVKQSPLMHLRVLILLYGMHRHVGEENDRYLGVGSIISYFGAMGISEVAIQRSVEFLLGAELVEPYDLSQKDYADDQKIAISQSGLTHLDLAVYNPIFLEQMALTTSIPDPDAAAVIRGAYHGKKPFDARLEDVRKAFCEYLLDEDARQCSVPATQEYKLQAELSEELAGRWIGVSARSREMLKLHEDTLIGVRGTVESFDQTRGFGFVSIPALKDTAFLHASVLERDGFAEVFDGDDLICDVSRNEKGFVVTKVGELNQADAPTLAGVVVKLFDERRYGFVHVEETGVDAFFHYHLLTGSQKRDLFEGQELLVEVVTDKNGRSQVRRIVG